jgi:hypothetical protein
MAHVIEALEAEHVAEGVGERPREATAKARKSAYSKKDQMR